MLYYVNCTYYVNAANTFNYLCTKYSELYKYSEYMSMHNALYCVNFIMWYICELVKDLWKKY